jgi:hypothetical protein
MAVICVIISRGELPTAAGWIPVPARYRASGDGSWEDDPGISFLRDTSITAILY